MRKLSIDLETYSPVKLKAGQYRYAEEVEILLFAYAFDNDPVRVIEVPRISWGEQHNIERRHFIPKEVYNALLDPAVEKWAFNAYFEMAQIESFFGLELDARQWHCTMVHAAYAGLPLSLESVAEVLGLPDQKNKDGKKLIKYFCEPCTPSRVNGGRRRNLPEHDPDGWKRFIEYCRQDVVVERQVRETLAWLPFPESERELWELDVKMTRRGARVDRPLARSAVRLDADFRAQKLDEMRGITQLQNPNSRNQLLAWLNEFLDEDDEEIDNLRAKELPKLAEYLGNDLATEAINLRLELSKTSVTKYKRVIESQCEDGKLHGITQIYGANRTGRYAGRIFQPQNLPKSEYSPEALDIARRLVMDENAEDLDFMYGSIPSTLSQVIRTVVIPSEGNILRATDFNSIEARVTAWLAGEQYRLDFFNKGGDIYVFSASSMFGVPEDSIIKKVDGQKIQGPNYSMRQRGKVAELAFGYGGGYGAAVKMGALEMGIKDEEIKPLVYKWRDANPAIVRLWRNIEAAAKAAIQEGRRTKCRGIGFHTRNGYLVITLPSGRQLYYYGVHLVPGEYGYEIYYYGVNQTKKKWEKQYTYGGKLVENIVQAIARDLLVNGLFNLDRAGYHPIFSVHDEIVTDDPAGFGSLEEMNVLACVPAPAWAETIPIKAGGFEGLYYRKD